MAKSDTVTKVLEGRRRGYPYSAIAQTLNITVEEAEAAYEEGINRDSSSRDPDEALALDLSRLDRMIQGLWPEASTGNPAAVKAMLDVMESRRRVLAAPPTTATVDSYEEAVKHLKLLPSDGALVTVGRKLAERIDAASGSFDQVKETKAMYLTPHLMNVLRELGATPAARAAVKSAREESGGKLASLRALRAAEDAAAS
jgi:hypothetical protein